jgi:uncharacterized protein (TIGR02646 family)
MAKYIYPADHIVKIKAVIAEKTNVPETKVWENASLKDVRNSLKRHIRLNRVDGNKCAYCLKSFHNEHNMNIDVEHILPKGDYSEYTFTLKNLTIACKRCNLQIKGSDTSFLNENFDRKKPFKSKYYKITHPVIDKNNLSLVEMHFQTAHIVKYQYNNIKSENTYNYFKLREVEIDTLNTAQGINPVIDFLSRYAQV